MGEEEIEPGLEGYSDSGSDFHDMPSPDLPAGIRKNIVVASTNPVLKRPTVKDEVAVHFKVAQAKDGVSLHSSREADGSDGSYRFYVGECSLMRALDLAVVTMRIHEVSVFTLTREFTADCPWRPPSDSVGRKHEVEILLEIELTDWTPRFDLLGNGSIIKRLLRRPDDNRRPVVGQVCAFSCGIHVEESGDIIRDLSEVVRTIQQPSNEKGHDSGDCSADDFLDDNLLYHALLSMKRGEHSAFRCSARTLFKHGVVLPDGVSESMLLSMEVELKDFHEESDVSFEKDGSIMKMSLHARDNWVRCSDAGLCKLVLVDVESSVEHQVQNSEVSFTIGDGEVCDQLEAMAFSMRSGEVAKFTYIGDERCEEPRIGLSVYAPVTFVVKIDTYEAGRPEHTIRGGAQLDFLTDRKESAVGLFKKGRYELAAWRFRQLHEAAGYLDDYRNARGGETRTLRVAALKRACLLNRALSLLKADLFRLAVGVCDSILDDEPGNSKALFRRAQARIGLGESQQAYWDAKAAAELEPESKEVQKLLLSVKRSLKKNALETRPLYEKMCNGLGSLPHPLDVD